MSSLVGGQKQNVRTIIMKNQELVDFLKECGVCQICQLRYLKARGTEYKNVKQTFAQLNINVDDEECTLTEDSDQRATKKPRLQPKICPTCLGLFSTEFQEKLVQGIINADIKKYDCQTIVIAITLPMLIQIRQLSMWIALLRKFDSCIDAGRAPDVPLKEAVKLILNPIICEKLQREYNANGLMINISLQHDQEETELATLQKLNEIAFPKSGKGKPQMISRGMLEKNYLPKQINLNLFEEHMLCPPSIPSSSLRLDLISLQGPAVFVAGRYCKFIRELSHTPWVINGKRVMEDSIEEIIIRNVAPFFCTDTSKVIFMSSGREDVDVRCLGQGRPFVLEIPDAIRTKLSCADAYKMEQNVDLSAKVSVRNLQVVQREELVHIKTGEEKKRKFYRALCALKEPATQEMLAKLNIPEEFQIYQKTPIRVLHRRPLHTRPRTIYSIKARIHRENYRVLILDIVSQAGTYIKELVHGDFGRTSPSISTILEKPIDIIALDVVGIDLDWPINVDNKTCE